MAKAGFKEHMETVGNIVIAEGYVREFERRGYLKSGAFIPEVVLEHPDLVRVLHEEFVHAGSDVVEAFTYYGHREKLRVIGREDDLERLNRTALKIARQGSRREWEEQVVWAVEENADFIIAETFNDFGEAMLALEAIKKYGKSLPAVITLTAYVPEITTDDVPFPEACRKLELAGAAVVGLNCARGPWTMLPLIKKIREVCEGPIAALPVPFTTTDKYPTFQSLKDPATGKSLYPLDVISYSCTRTEIRRFAEEAKDAGVSYIGLCCGNASNYLREVAEVYGRKPKACKYSPDISLSYIHGREKSKEYRIASKLRQYTGIDN
ncbi:hypothetical protein KUTeg_007974 [Tegillarca granosa]|uniref:Hcy-binding domain-containing protein n=1 Tax=Tegillarca granosa TaxID=220873 RepID=A0ABQ9FEV7_TEGGR|nr:hypothetical protein KUTeg_007974 [Tegillarca granosa]